MDLCTTVERTKIIVPNVKILANKDKYKLMI